MKICSSIPKPIINHNHHSDAQLMRVILKMINSPAGGITITLKSQECSWSETGEVWESMLGNIPLPGCTWSRQEAMKSAVAFCKKFNAPIQFVHELDNEKQHLV